MTTAKFTDSLSLSLNVKDLSRKPKSRLPLSWQIPNFAYYILKSYKSDLKKGDGTTVAKAIAQIAFLMLDEIQTKARYILKSGKKEAALSISKMKSCEKCVNEEYLGLLECYGLFLRRARRKRDILAQIVVGIEEFYAENPFEELEETIFFGTKALAHIDIMISLHEEELNHYYLSFAMSGDMQGEKNGAKQSVL